MKPQYKLHKLMTDLPSEVYHAIKGTFSSSQFKDLLEDEEIFIKKHIHRTIEKVEIPAFATGTYFHTGVLEPHKINTDCATFDGIRRGAKWEAFKKKNANKTIVTVKQIGEAKGLVSLVHESPIAMGYVSKGKPEISLFVRLIVTNGGDIIAPFYGKRLTRNGWESYTKHKSSSRDVEIIVKVRADSMGHDFILDLKSTTGNARNVFEMREKIKYYNYDLSASLYMDIFSLERPTLKKFVWTFASKDCHNCRTYEASEKNIMVGRIKFMKAIKALAVCMRNEWQLYDSLGTLDPHPSELWHLEERDEDLL